MWTYSPTFAVIVGTITCVVLLWANIWFDKVRRTGKKYTSAVYFFGRRMFYVIFAYLGLFMIDMVLRICFSSIVSFGNFAKYALSAVILCSILSIVLIIRTIFTAPTWKSLIVFFVMLVGTFSLTIFSFMGGDVNSEDMFYILYVGLGLEVVLNLIDFFHSILKRKKKGESIKLQIVQKKKKPKKESDKGKGKENEEIIIIRDLSTLLSPPLWDLSRNFKKIFNMRTYILLFAFFCAELILLFEGLSLLCWI
ncbi:MAG: hypothetical protein ACTSWN_04735 [Promethearchaeota archaeon]